MRVVVLHGLYCTFIYIAMAFYHDMDIFISLILAAKKD